MDAETTANDVAWDLLPALEAFEGLVGSEETRIESVEDAYRETLLLTLSNGDKYEIRVRRVTK